MITIRYYIYISFVFGIFRLLLCMFNSLFLVITFIISLHISSHHLTVIYSYWDFLGSFSGSNTVALMFFLCFPYFSLSYMRCAHLLYSGYRPPRLEELRTRTTTNLPSHISTSSLRVPTLYSSYCASIPVTSY